MYLNKSQKSSLSTHGIKELIFTEVSSSPFPSWIYKNTYMLHYLMKILNHLNLCTKCTSQYKIEAKDSVLKWELGVARTFTTGWNMRPNKESTMNNFSCTVGNNRLKDDVPLFRIFGLILMIFLGKLEQVDIQPMSS